MDGWCVVAGVHEEVIGFMLPGHNILLDAETSWNPGLPVSAAL